MQHKTVAQLDADGVFVCPTIADESPLEPGVFLIPGGAIEVDPPDVPSGHLARWEQGVWVFEAVLTTPTPLNEAKGQAAHSMDDAKPVDPIEKLRDFLDKNPDVEQLLKRQ